MSESPTQAPGDPTEEVVLCDNAGRSIGLADKTSCHRGRGRLHRALTCVLFDDDGRLLFGRRSPSKPTWPGYWDATVATHPFPGEGDEDATTRRVRQELGVDSAGLRCVATVHYQATYSSEWAENEVCAVLLGRLSKQQANRLVPADGEIDRVTWVTLDELGPFVASRPVAPWFHLTWDELQLAHRDALAAYVK